MRRAQKRRAARPRAEQAVADTIRGEGLFEYRNPGSHDLELPHPAEGGVRLVGPGRTFFGSDYYKSLVRDGTLRLVRVVEPPAPEVHTESTAMSEEKLILDQPDAVTTRGAVENVVAAADDPVADDPAPEEVHESGIRGGDVLLLEKPTAGSFQLLNGD